MVKKHMILITVSIVIIYAVFIRSNQNIVPAEKLEIVSGAGVDVLHKENGTTEYQVSLSVYTFKEKDIIGSMIKTGSAFNIPQTREERQLQSDHKYISAIQKVLVFSDELTREGLENELDILFANPFSNAMSWVVVCKGNAIDVLSHQTESYPSSADYISELVESSKNYNFFSDNYKVIDMYVRVDAEGRSLVLPYVETIDGKVEITGMALFNKDKMVDVIDINETRIMNMLREDNATGILGVQKNFEDYASCFCKSKRKVSCERNDNQYVFTIDLEITGELVSNTLFEGMEEDLKILEKYEEELKIETEQQCMEFIYNLKNNYQVDCLELGRYACAKYGRKTDVDWNEVVSNSIIEVNIDITVNRFGRGRYLID